VSKLLGHSSIAITADTYSHLLAGVGREAAERASALVPRAAREPRDQSVTNEAPAGGAEGMRQQEAPEMEILASRVGPVGLEPTTYGLKVRSSAY
jgi:hypothetical protein